MIPIAKPFLTQEEAQSAYDTILTGWVTQGPKVEEFERKFADYVGAKYAVAVSNCTVALHLAMILADVKEGDEVICPSMSYIATANSIKYVGAKPIFAEVGEDFNLDINDCKKKLTTKTKAILLVHQVGNPADIDGFKKLCSEYNLRLIEDAACAVGSSYQGKKIGSHSDLVCFSFHPRKVITTGDGGMITTGDEKFYRRAKLLRQHSMSITDRERHGSNKVIFEDHLELGFNYRMTDIQAAVGIKQLEKLDFIISERRKIAARYNEAFRSLKGVRIPHEANNTFRNYQSYVLTFSKDSRLSRNQFMEMMLKEGIATKRGVMTAHRESAYREEFSHLSLPISESLSDNSVILPLFYPMVEEIITNVIQKVMKLLT